MIARDPTHRPARRTKRRGGFTLIELVATIAITSVIMLGIASAMLIAGHAVPDADNPVAAGIAAGRVLEQTATELQYAVSVVDSNTTTIEFTVADRDGNDVPETIRYEWSGTPGEPLTRQYNGGTAVEVLTDVNQFALSYDLKTVTTETQSATESSETSLSSYDSTQSLSDFAIKSDEWYAQYFLPSLPADAISWKVTRVQFRAASHATSTGESRVQLQSATAGGAPSGTLLEERTLLESTLTNKYMLQEFTFSNVTQLPPDQGLCLVFKWIANATACRIEGQSSGVTPTDGHLLMSTNSGGSWAVQSGQSLLYSVYGTVTTMGEPQIETLYHLCGTTLVLQAGEGSQSPVQTAVRVLNEPKVTP